MNEIKLLKENKKGKKYKYNDFDIFYRGAGVVSGDNNTNPFERILLVSGKAKVVIENKIFEVEAPYEIIIPEKKYHKIIGITDIIFLLFGE